MTPHTEFVERKVEQLFSQLPTETGYCRNPVTGSAFAMGIDPIEPQKEMARRALFARQMHIFNAPIDVQPLPLTMVEWDAMSRRGTLLHYICAKYARSLSACSYDLSIHPTFDAYVAGYLWDAEQVAGIADITHHGREQLEKLKKLYPPRELEGFGSGSAWRPPRTQQ